MYRNFKETSEFELKIGVFFVENGSLKMETRDLTVGGVCQQQSFLSNGPRLCEAVEKMATVRIRVKRLIILSSS